MRELAVHILALLFFVIASQAQAPASPTKLPLKLVGTIVLSEQGASVASVLLTETKATEAYRSGSQIGSLAKILKVERDRLTVKNLKTGKSEIVPLAAFEQSRAVSQAAIEKGNKEFHVRRSIVDHTLSDLGSFLQKARMIPVEGGFRFEWIEAGSLYEKLGLKAGDTIKDVNGTKLTTPMAAMALYEQLRNSSMVRLGIERGGKPLSLTYLIRE